MKKLVFLLAFLSIFLLPVDVQASSLCDLEYLPTYPSVNSSMLLTVPRAVIQTKLDNLTAPMKITFWVVDDNYNVVDEGALFLFNDCWICEFSGKVSNFYGMCGPTPFKSSGKFSIYFTARDFENRVEFNRTIIVHQDILNAGVNVDSSGDVHITVDAPTDTQDVWMTLFNAGSGESVKNFNKTSLRKGDYPGRYFMDITSLPVGSYYASFNFRTSVGKTGGGVAKFEIKTSEVELSVQTDSDSYWIGEEVQITGQAKYSQVSASVRLPNGRTESLGTKNVVNQQFSYTFQILNTFGEGNYLVTVNAGGGTAQDTFTAQRIVDILPAALSFLVTNRTTTLVKTVTIKNTGNNTISLSSSTEGVTSYVTLNFDKTTLTPSSTSTLTVRVNPAALSSSVAGKINLKVNGIVTIPVDVAINLNLPGAVGGDAVIKVSPGFWETDDCLVGKAVTPSFTVQNKGKGQLSGFGSTLSSELDGITQVTLPSSSVSESSFGSIELSITPDFEDISGEVEITSNGGSATIYVSMDCIRDVTDDIQTLQSNIESLKADFLAAGYDSNTIDNRIFDTLDAELENALSSFNDDDYSASKRSYANARVIFDTLGSVSNEMVSVPTAQGTDALITMIVVIVVLIIIGALGFFLYKKFGSKILGVGGGGEEEEPYDEELY